MKTLNFIEMEAISGGISFGCAMAWVGLGLGYAGIFAAGVVASVATAGVAVGVAAGAMVGYTSSIVGVVVGCS